MEDTDSSDSVEAGVCERQLMAVRDHVCARAGIDVEGGDVEALQFEPTAIATVAATTGE
ncbi:hypothetical protein D3C83_288190 [compost metagenome]